MFLQLPLDLFSSTIFILYSYQVLNFISSFRRRSARQKLKKNIIINSKKIKNIDCRTWMKNLRPIIPDKKILE